MNKKEIREKLILSKGVEKLFRELRILTRVRNYTVNYNQKLWEQLKKEHTQEIADNFISERLKELESPDNIIGLNFPWGSTPEGYAFWKEKHSKLGENLVKFKS